MPGRHAYTPPVMAINEGHDDNPWYPLEGQDKSILVCPDMDDRPKLRLQFVRCWWTAMWVNQIFRLIWLILFPHQLLNLCCSWIPTFSWILVKSLSVLQLNPSVVAVATFPCSHHFRFLSPLAWKIWTGNSPIVSQDVSIRNSRGETEFSVSICFNQKFNMFPNVTHQPINHDLSLRPRSPRFSVFPWNALLLGRRGTECTVLSTWCLNLRPFLGLQVPVLSIHSCWKKS